MGQCSEGKIMGLKRLAEIILNGGPHNCMQLRPQVFRSRQENIDDFASTHKKETTFQNGRVVYLNDYRTGLNNDRTGSKSLEK